MSDTAQIREDEGFDESRVADYLRDHLGSLVGDGPIEFAQFPGGKANLTYLASSPRVELVLRRPPLGETAPGSHDMAREHRVLAVLHDVYPRAPRAYAYCGDADVMGKPFFVMERRNGHVIRGVWPEELEDTPGFRGRVAAALVDALVDLHRVDYTAIGLGDLGRPDGFVARQVAGWADRWRRAQVDEVPVMDAVAERLAATIPEPQAAVILHNDFKLDNTMVDGDGEVTSVFDWDMCTTGDPLVDLGTTLSYWGGTGGMSDVVAADAQALGEVMAVADVAERYAAGTGFDLSRLDWYRALGLFRIAVIVQQIYVRFVRGQTRDERFAALGGVVAPLAEGAAELLG